MNILQIISYLYPAWSYGGPGKLVYELSNQLALNGHHVEVYTTDAFNIERRRRPSDNPFTHNPHLTVFQNLSNTLAYRYKTFLSPMVFYSVPTSIKRFDAVHIHEIFTPLAVAAARACKKSNVPLFVSAHGTVSCFHLKHRGWAKNIFFRFFGTDFHAANGYIAATKAEESEYDAFGINPARIHHVPNGINTKIFETLPKDGTFRARYHIRDTEFVLLYIGRIHHLKGLDRLVEAFAHVRNTTAAKLVIGGTDDGYLDTLKRKIHHMNIENDVLFHGIVSGEKKLQVLADADIFVYPSPAEGFSLAILEAGAAGLPLVITEGCKFPQVERSGAGVVTDSSIQGFTAGILSLLNHPQKLRPAGEAARRLVQKQYSIQSMAETLQSVYARSV